MIKKEIKVHIPSGMEARPIALLVQVASQFESNIYVETEDKTINAKSIMGMMSLGIDTGETITITADGHDEEEAIEEMEKYLTNKD